MLQNLTLRVALGLAVLLIALPAAHAQFGGPPTTAVHDPAALKPPPGVKVAIVEFDDMECPDCAAANPVLMEAVAKYHIPWIRHDFPLPFHPWSFEAAVYARWFDTHSKQIGDDYRNSVFANQPSIETRADLLSFTQRFAEQHGLQLPFLVDPQGKLADEVKADRALGQRIGVDHTPTIWIVTSGGKTPPFVEVVDRSKLFQMIDQALAETRR
ncbi:MAG TPA: thioredoxin domain-containing protein [Terracidiphilus sp.]|nr:thioredoxin domain-containing protein [Terracidiphilus sp.]